MATSFFNLLAASASAAAAAKASKRRSDLLREALLFLLVALGGVLGGLGVLVVFVLAMMMEAQVASCVVVPLLFALRALRW